MLNSDIIQNLEIIEEQLGTDHTPIVNNNIAYQCPFCLENGDTHTDKKLYINVTNGKFICFRCEKKGKISLDNGLGSNADVYKLLGNILGSFDESTEEVDDDELNLFMIPKHKPQVGTLAYDSIISRGIPPEDIDFYDIRVADSKFPQFQGRYIIPNEITGKIFTDMYVARTYMDSKIRYKNPHNSKRNRIVFNLHRIPDNPNYIIINEGCINSIIASRLSVATYGKYVSDTQENMILAKNPKSIYVSLDTDAQKQALKLCRNLKSKRPDIKVYNVRLPDNKDAADLGRTTYWKYVMDAEEYVNRTNYVISNFMKSYITQDN